MARYKRNNMVIPAKIHKNGRLIVVPPIPDRQYPGYVQRQNRNQWYRYIKAPVLR